MATGVVKIEESDSEGMGMGTTAVVDASVDDEGLSVGEALSVLVVIADSAEPDVDADGDDSEAAEVDVASVVDASVAPEVDETSVAVAAVDVS